MSSEISNYPKEVSGRQPLAPRPELLYVWASYCPFSRGGELGARDGPLEVRDIQRAEQHSIICNGLRAAHTDTELREHRRT